MCRLQICADYKHVQTTNTCRLQTCADYKHFHISTILQHFPLRKKSGLQMSQSCLCVWRVSPIVDIFNQLTETRPAHLYPLQMIMILIYGKDYKSLCNKPNLASACPLGSNIPPSTLFSNVLTLYHSSAIAGTILIPSFEAMWFDTGALTPNLYGGT